MPYSIVRQTIDPRALSVNVTSYGGRVFRWGPDEKDAFDVPSGLTITTQMPGGFATMNCTLNRRPDLPYSDLDRFAPCSVTGAGGALTAFDGYLSARPLNRDTQYAFQPNAIGWAGEMQDNNGFSEVYIDRELSQWQPPTNARQLTLLSLGYNLDVWSSTPTADVAGFPALIISGEGAWTGQPLGELWYDSGAGNLISAIAARYVNYGNFTSGDTNAVTQLYVSVDTNASGYTAGTALNPNTAAQTLSVTGGPYRYGLLQARYAVSAGSAITYGWDHENLQVIGNHGLTMRTGPSGAGYPAADNGFYGGDIAAHIIANSCPHLSVTRGTVTTPASPGSNAIVYNDTVVIPHLVFNTPTTATTAMQQLNQYYLYDYGVYENRKFFWRPPGTGVQWHVRLSEGVQLQDQGPQIETCFNACVVQYTDAAGITRYVGPPGKTWDIDPVTSATSSALLQDTTATNPANQYGRTRTALVQLGTSSWQIAVQVGNIFLATSSGRPSSGSLTATGFAKDSNGRQWPVWMMRAGDTVVIDDSSDQTVHYILETSYAHDSLQQTLTLDAPPNQVDWLTARLGLAVSALG